MRRWSTRTRSRCAEHTHRANGASTARIHSWPAKLADVQNLSQAQENVGQNNSLLNRFFTCLCYCVYDVLSTAQWRSRADKLSRATFAHAIVATGGRPHRGDTPGAEVCLTSGTALVRMGGQHVCSKQQMNAECHTIIISFSLRIGSSVSDWYCTYFFKKI